MKDFIGNALFVLFIIAVFGGFIAWITYPAYTHMPAKEIHLGNADSATTVCQAHGGVATIGGGDRHGHGNAAVCKDGSAFNVPISIPNPEYTVWKKKTFSERLKS